MKPTSEKSSPVKKESKRVLNFMQKYTVEQMRNGKHYFMKDVNSYKNLSDNELYNLYLKIQRVRKKEMNLEREKSKEMDNDCRAEVCSYIIPNFVGFRKIAKTNTREKFISLYKESKRKMINDHVTFFPNIKKHPHMIDHYKTGKYQDRKFMYVKNYIENCFFSIEEILLPEFSSEELEVNF